MAVVREANLPHWNLIIIYICWRVAVVFNWIPEWVELMSRERVFSRFANLWKECSETFPRTIWNELWFLSGVQIARKTRPKTIEQFIPKCHLWLTIAKCDTNDNRLMIKNSLLFIRVTYFICSFLWISSSCFICPVFFRLLLVELLHRGEVWTRVPRG